MSLMSYTFLPGVPAACSSSPIRDCWLCEEVVRWNGSLRRFCLELEEEEPGNLCLRTLNTAWRHGDGTYGANDVSYSATYALAWLSRQHRCVKRLSLGHDVFDSRWTPFQLEIFGPGSAVERIEISGSATRCWNVLLNAVGVVVTLKSLRIEDAVIDSGLTSRLAELLAANGGCLQELVISASDAIPDVPRQLICAVDQCKALNELSLGGRLTLEATTALERLLQSKKRIQKLSLRDKRRSQAFLSALCGGLSLNFSPTELQYECSNSNFGELLKLLKFNRVLKHLVLSGNKCEPGTFGKHDGMSLHALLAHSTGLRSLAVRHCTWTLDAAEEVAAGLSLNGPLEHFDLSQCHLDLNAVLKLCRGLNTNNTLKLLAFCPDEKFLHAPVGLLGRLVAAQCFTRVVTMWPEAYVPALTEALKVPALCPPELHIGCFGFSDRSFPRLCAALGSSTIKHLSVKFSNCDLIPAVQLREAVIANGSIKTLALQEDSMSTDACFVVAKALEQNRTVTEISLSINKLDDKTFKCLISVATDSDALEKVSLNCITAEPWNADRLCSISHRLWCNDTLTGFYIFEERYLVERRVAEVNDHVDNNRSKWNCALQFVLEPCTNKRRAEAFELLQKKPCFLPRIAATTGKSLEDALGMVRLAKHFIARNYFLVTGVVSRGVTCHPHQRTQVDSLNSDCWLAIGQYLNVSDVRDEVGIPDGLVNWGSYYSSTNVSSSRTRNFVH